MTMRQQATVVGVFEDRQLAEKAINELTKAGFGENQIGFAMKFHEETGDPMAAESKTHAESGAVTGALTGLGLGALAGLGVLAGVIPVVGPAVAAGTLGIILTNAAAGAAVAGLVGALVGAGVPEDEAKYYQHEFDAGRVLVTVAAGPKAGEVAAILRRCGAYDMAMTSNTSSV
jgi:hypothetical protein